MGDVRKRPFRSALSVVPSELLNQGYECPNCTEEIKIPWLEKMEFPKQPVVPNQGGGYFVPVSIPLFCKNCRTRVDAGIKNKKIESRYDLYGDEAARFISKKNVPNGSKDLKFFCITLVGLPSENTFEMKRAINNLKKKVAPSKDPRNWAHHFTEIWSSKPNSKKFSLSNKYEKIAYGKEFANLIKKAKPKLVTFNVSSCIKLSGKKRKRAEFQKLQKEEIFSQSLTTTLKQMRENNKCLTWTFDNIKDTSAGARTEGWANECFLGLQYTRLFAYLAAGAPVFKPKFVKPGSHFLLEIADFISYCVAREFEKSLRGTETELPSALMGNGFYQATLGNGDVMYKWNEGLPLKKFYDIV